MLSGAMAGRTSGGNSDGTLATPDAMPSEPYKNNAPTPKINFAILDPHAATALPRHAYTTGRNYDTSRK